MRAQGLEVLVEDVIDTGLTLNYLLRNLQARQPASLDVCVLFNKPEHRLITGGLYRFIRHPRYLGLLVMLLGFALVFNTWVGAAADLALLAALLWRISDEEKLLQREFGPAWEAYARRTPRLIPGIW